MLLLIALILILVAIGGGFAISHLLFALIALAVILFLFDSGVGRRGRL
jgi:hypothetical protein